MEVKKISLVATCAARSDTSVLWVPLYAFHPRVSFQVVLLSPLGSPLVQEDGVNDLLVLLELANRMVLPLDGDDIDELGHPPIAPMSAWRGKNCPYVSNRMLTID